jgi:aspartyl-tRNA(Asn)/glutamyl-tRNA(Gln) amidotransferase subunit C
MSVSREEVLRIAQLAELHVEEEQLPMLVEQMSRILDYVAQLSQLPAGEMVKPFLAGPDATGFHADEVRPAPLARSPAEMAPAFKDGYFLVPKLGQFGSVDDVPEEE